MLSRQKRIGLCVARALLAPARYGASISLVARILAFFSLLSVPLRRRDGELFSSLRGDVWQLDEEQYHDSFASALVGGGGGGERDGDDGDDGVSDSDSNSPRGLKAVGDLGYSGSVFFATRDGRFLVKSLDRYFEYDHFERDMLRPYAAHMRAHPAESLLVRITDYLGAAPTLGALLGLTPRRCMVMENLMAGRDNKNKSSWQSYDLKPADYFFPERDVAGGALAPASVKERLTDRFNDKVRVSRADRDGLMRVLEADTALLQATNCVDYSLFLIRYPTTTSVAETQGTTSSASWRHGMPAADGRWTYRLVLLDFFFAKHRLQPRLLTALVNLFNCVCGSRGPMSITTDPTEYRTRFLSMVDALIEVT